MYTCSLRPQTAQYVNIDKTANGVAFLINSRYGQLQVTKASVQLDKNYYYIMVCYYKNIINLTKRLTSVHVVMCFLYMHVKIKLT